MEVTIQLQMQIPASRKIALTVLSFDLFSCSELRFKQVAGREQVLQRSKVSSRRAG